MGAKLDDYRAVAPRGSVDFMLRIADRLRGRRIAQVSVSRYGGAAAEILKRIVPILNDLGIETGWEVVIGSADFDAIVTAVNKGLAGVEQVVTEAMLARLHATCASNAGLPLDADLVIVHDAAALLLVEGRPPEGAGCGATTGTSRPPSRSSGTRCAPSSTSTTPRFSRRVRGAAVDPPLPHRALDRPALSEAQPRMPRVEQGRHLERLGPRRQAYTAPGRPLRATPGSAGVINAYRLVKLHHDVRLILAGPPPGPERCSGDAGGGQPGIPTSPSWCCPGPGDRAQRARARRHHRPAEAALHRLRHRRRRGHVEGQAHHRKPGRWHTRSDRVQVTGYTVETVEGAAFRIRHLLGNPEMIGRMGAAGREHVRRNFLITRHLGDYLALLAYRSGQTLPQTPAQTSPPTSVPTSAQTLE
jgi:trehalose synthase